MNVVRLLLTASLLLLIPGCYAYVPSTVDEVGAGMSIRARVTPEQASEFAQVLGSDARSARLLEGELLAKTDSSLFMEVAAFQRTRGIRVQSVGQRLHVPLRGITEVELREADNMRTGLLIGGGLAAIGVGIALGLSGDDADTSRPDDTPRPRELRIPLSLPLDLFLGRR